MAKTWPPIVSVAVRGGAESLRATENSTLPFPDPLAPAVIVTHESLGVAVHEQPAGLVTDTVPVPPCFGKLWLVGESV
jgi:hypothetical protein